MPVLLSSPQPLGYTAPSGRFVYFINKREPYHNPELKSVGNMLANALDELHAEVFALNNLTTELTFI